MIEPLREVGPRHERARFRRRQRQTPRGCRPMSRPTSCPQARARQSAFGNAPSARQSARQESLVHFPDGQSRPIRRRRRRSISRLFSSFATSPRPSGRNFSPPIFSLIPAARMSRGRPRACARSRWSFPICRIPSATRSSTAWSPIWRYHIELLTRERGRRPPRRPRRSGSVIHEEAHQRRRRRVE